MSTEGRVVQSSASRTVRHVDITEQRDQSLCAAYRLVASCDVERRLPVLVPSINIRAVLQQHCNCILDESVQIEGFFISCISRFVVCLFVSFFIHSSVCRWLCVNGY